MALIFIDNQASVAIKTNTTVGGAQLSTLAPNTPTGNFELDGGKTYQIQVNENGGEWAVAIFEYNS